MGALEESNVFGIRIRESANDGSDFANPPADYRVAFLGEDGVWHVKDSAGTVTNPFTGGSGIVDTIMDAKGDIITATAADTPVRKAAGANGSLLMASSGQADGLKWTPGLYVARRIAVSQTDATFNVNSTTYLEAFFLDFYHDWDQFPATHFAISACAASNAGSQSILLQLALAASPTNPVSAGGDDLTIPNNGSVVQLLTSSWIAVSDAMSGFSLMTLAIKGSNSTVDLLYRSIDVHFKIAA